MKKMELPDLSEMMKGSPDGFDDKNVRSEAKAGSPDDDKSMFRLSLINYNYYTIHFL